MSAREVLAAAYDASLFRPHRTNTQAADGLIDALAAAGYSIVADNHARIDGQVVRLHQPTDGRKKAVLFRKLRDWWPEKVAVDSKRGVPLYVAVPLDSEEAPDA